MDTSGFWDGYGTVSSRHSRIAVAVPILSVRAICRQLWPWSRSCLTSAALTLHVGLPLWFFVPEPSGASVWR
jgi:hypothetical protein